MAIVGALYTGWRQIEIAGGGASPASFSLADHSPASPRTLRLESPPIAKRPIDDARLL